MDYGYCFFMHDTCMYMSSGQYSDIYLVVVFLFKVPNISTVLSSDW